MTAVLAARIGPNAITQVAAALDGSLGDGAAAPFLRGVGLGAYVSSPPQDMVDEWEVIALHGAVREQLAPDAAQRIERMAGLATAQYLLAHRIPAAAQRLLKTLPAAWASRALLKAIGRHAWTFAGSGQFRAEPGTPVVITLSNCPLARDVRSDTPVCDYYAATFEGLFQALVHPQATVVETQCQSMGAAACRFEISWP
jgi:divinyl protochlorophyllide a 8-vinyl-reductase